MVTALYSLIGIIPVLFSHLPYVVGIPFSFELFGNYEWLRIAFLGVLCLILLGVQWYTHVRPIGRRVTRKMIGVVGAWVGVYLIHIFQGANWLQELVGVAPFYAWFLQMGVGIALFWILLATPKTSLIRIWQALVASLIFALLYGYIQYFGLDPIVYQTSFESGRVFSVLWNANTYAIFLLMFLPLVLLRTTGYFRIGGGIILLSAIATTGSWSCMIFALLYVLWAICYLGGTPRWWYILCFILFGISVLQYGAHMDWQSKWLSGSTRFALLQEAIRLMEYTPRGILTGYSQQELFTFLNEHRSQAMLQYVSPEYQILHFHSTFLDLTLRFGVVYILVFLYVIKDSIRTIWSDTSFTGVLVLFVAAGSIHELELPHWILLITLYFVSTVVRTYDVVKR